jgi:hypothetical protein
MPRIRLIERLTDTVARISVDGDVAVWGLVKLRKEACCVATNRHLSPGDQAYRPLGNQMYRSYRVASTYVDQHPVTYDE